jgi:hypothetical protein
VLYFRYLGYLPNRINKMLNAPYGAPGHRLAFKKSLHPRRDSISQANRASSARVVVRLLASMIWICVVTLDLGPQCCCHPTRSQHTDSRIRPGPPDTLDPSVVHAAHTRTVRLPSIAWPDFELRLYMQLTFKQHESSRGPIRRHDSGAHKLEDRIASPPPPLWFFDRCSADTHVFATRSEFWMLTTTGMKLWLSW